MTDLEPYEDLAESRLAPETPMDAGSQALSEALRSSFGIVKILMVILVGVFIFSGVFQVGPQERAILLRFGKPLLIRQLKVLVQYHFLNLFLVLHHFAKLLIWLWVFFLHTKLLCLSDHKFYVLKYSLN